MPEFSLRPATEEDSSIIYKLVVEGKINPTGLDWKRFVVVEEINEGIVIGCGQIKPHRDGSQELASIAVKTVWRKQGIARQIIDYLIQQHEGDLYLMCGSRLGSYYEKFNFHILEENDMPRYFKRISKITSIVETLSKQGQILLIMKLEK